MKIEKPINQNYCCTVAKVTKIIPLDNCDNVCGAIVCGNHVIVSKDTIEGQLGIYMPVEVRVAEEFLRNNNMYRDTTLNKDSEQKGYFEKSGRIRAMRFRGHVSDGIFLSPKHLEYVSGSYAFKEGDEFDHLNGQKICEKMVVVKQKHPSRKDKKVKKVYKSRMIEGQFKLHTDTAQLNKCIANVLPEDHISVTNKLHGTSAVFGNIQVLRKLNFFEKVLKFFGVQIKDAENDLIYASRNVIKNSTFERALDKTKGYYNEDIWGHWARLLKPLIPKGFVVYGEIVGYTADNSMVQKGYHYGCQPGKSEFYCYKMTFTNEDGVSHLLGFSDMVRFCSARGINTVPTLYVGKAKTLYPEIPIDENWGKNFVERLDKDERLGMANVKCPLNNYEVPSEGIVVKVESALVPHAYKLKNFAFREMETKQIDAGEVNIEDEN